jgi:hypothetical protein
MDVLEFYQFWDLLFDTGLFGRVEHQETSASGRYVVGRFSYNQRDSIVVGEKDEICHHPLLTSYLRGEHDNTLGACGPVYPRGSWQE